MNNLFSKHINEIGQQKEPIKKFAKGNVVPQKRTSIDESATNYFNGTIGVGREDFWIINVDKNGTNRWKPLGLKSKFADLKNNSLWVFDGAGVIQFCLNENFRYDTGSIFNFNLRLENNLNDEEIKIDFKGVFGIHKIGFSNSPTANNIFDFIVGKIEETYRLLSKGELDKTLNSFMPSQTENKLYPITDKLFAFLISISEVINLGLALQEKIYKDAFSSVTLFTIDSGYHLLKLFLTPTNTKSVADEIEEYRQKFLANNIIDNLPPYIKGIAINEQVRQGNLRNEYLVLTEKQRFGGFTWEETELGAEIWENINLGEWDDATLKAFAPNLEDLLSPPPQYVPNNITTNFGLNIGDKLPEKVINDWSKLANNYCANDRNDKWTENNTYFSGDRQIIDFKIIDGQLGFQVSETLKVYLKAEGFKEFMEQQTNSASTTETPKSSERVFTDDEIKWLIKTKRYAKDTFRMGKIEVANEIQSTNFQELFFALGGERFPYTQEIVYLGAPYIIIDQRNVIFSTTNSDEFKKQNASTFDYYGVFDLLLNETINPVIAQKEHKATEETAIMPISKDIKQLEEEYEDVTFLISITPKVDIVSMTELKQRQYELKKEIDLLHLKRADELLKSNNIFQSLFESSSVEPIYRYDLTPDPNGFAPDGTPTKLPRGIYDFCQTKDFMDWFGNYKNLYNYKNSPYESVPCSSIITEHYEPKIVFHGTGAEFSYFDFEQFPAMYFAENFSYAEWFAEQKGTKSGHVGYVYPFLLNVRNYLDLTDFELNEVSYEDFADSIFIQTGLEPSELNINPALVSAKSPVWAWVYLRNSPEFLKKIRDMKLFDGIIYYEQNPPINPTAPNYMTKGFIIFEPQNAKIVATNRKEMILPSMRSFYLKKGGKL